MNEKSRIEKITGDNRRPGMPETHTYLVRHNPHPNYGWLSCATFATQTKAAEFASSLQS